MMHKNFIAVLALVWAVAVTAQATVAPEQMSLAGVTPGMTIAQLESACGQPQRKTDDNWHYSTFKVEFDDDRPGIVESVSSRVPPTATAAGVAVGQSESVLVPAYGAPDRKEVDDGETEYEYYTPDASMKLEFDVRGGSIVKISCSLRD
ncbi:MAG: hypothetical protein ILO10_01285 [Kiritimatiellae bacterium]|nr:hypothetical protein [Kiritimatiellia bacterium]